MVRAGALGERAPSCISHFGLGYLSEQRRNTFDTWVKAMYYIILPIITTCAHLRPPENYPGLEDGIYVRLIISLTSSAPAGLIDVISKSTKECNNYIKFMPGYLADEKICFDY